MAAGGGRRDLGAEDGLLAWLRRRLAAGGGSLIGDDAAALPPLAAPVVTVDQQIAGVHFPAGLDPALCARRLLAVTLSDLAAMGAEPVYAFLALALPPSVDARRYLSAVTDGCRRHGMQLAGGDVSGGDRLAASLTVIGRRPRGGRLVRRSGARPGDGLWIGGTLGESAAGRLLLAAGARRRRRRLVLPRRFASSRGLHRAAARAVRRHLEPEAQLELGRWLGRRRWAAAIDVSDGLALDLHRLCRESGLGAEVDLARLPLAPRLREIAAALGRGAEELALSGGEDYVLLFTLAPSTRPPAGFGCSRIGRIRREPEVVLRTPSGIRPLPPAGWDHLR